MDIEQLADEALYLLTQLIKVPSYSREEQGTAHLIQQFFQKRAIPVKRRMNNVWVQNRHFDPSKPVLLLNAHHDTVKPVSAYTRDPFSPALEEGKLYGLGSNDAGGCLVSLIAAFLYYYEAPDLKYNILLAATAEEEISGKDGIELLLQHLDRVDMGIVGEPTGMRMAVAEKGLMVIDCLTQGVAGHAARKEGVNAIYQSMNDISWFREFSFPLVSEQLGPVTMNVTMIEAGVQHNVIPASCRFTVDIRLNEHYTHEALLHLIQEQVSSQVTARSMRLKPSSIAADHVLVRAGVSIGLETFGSSTLSDMALMPFPAIKLGPGASARSHTADEFIYLQEIREAVVLYIELIKQLQ